MPSFLSKVGLAGDRLCRADRSNRLFRRLVLHAG